MVKINSYAEINDYLNAIEYLEVFGGCESESEMDKEELDDLNIIRHDFTNNCVTRTTLNLLSSYLSGCGGSVNFFLISKETFSTNSDAITFLRNNINMPLKKYHHCDDWSLVNCNILIIGDYYFLESFQQG